ncbi:hypothetical protein M501DRAFT_937097 [Patellaria atrata CBS 101060]|uniref:Protein kinase domain-containing protein n=1 Tax=Patellaria atrata CBS 101060 TaxID=1346257 RepID=A0A9P4S9Z2_9PEZI|nr:hypothetical protein M501DRAFT_937097 [Patellaria atrata CBS 101060]
MSFAKHTVQYPLSTSFQDPVGAGVTATVNPSILWGFRGCFDLTILHHGSVRHYYANQAKPVSLSLQLRWAEQIMASVNFIYSRNVLHSDIPCNNILLDEGFNAKLADFAGSSIDGEEALIGYDTSREHPEYEITDVSTGSEIFVLGSTFSEIMTGSQPYKELSDEEIACAYRGRMYPSLVSLPAFKDIIHKR